MHSAMSRAKAEHNKREPSRRLHRRGHSVHTFKYLGPEGPRLDSRTHTKQQFIAFWLCLWLWQCP